MAGVVGFVKYLRGRQIVQLRLMGGEQTDKERLWERIGQLETRISHLEQQGREDTNTILKQAIQIVRLENMVADRDAAVTTLEEMVADCKRLHGKNQIASAQGGM